MEGIAGHQERLLGAITVGLGGSTFIPMLYRQADTSDIPAMARVRAGEWGIGRVLERTDIRISQG